MAKKGHSFPKSFGFTGSSGQVQVKSHSREPVHKAKGGLVRPKIKIEPRGLSTAQKVGIGLGAGIAGAYGLSGGSKSEPKPESNRQKHLEDQQKALGLRRGGRVGKR